MKKLGIIFCTFYMCGAFHQVAAQLAPGQVIEESAPNTQIIMTKKDSLTRRVLTSPAAGAVVDQDGGIIVNPYFSPAGDQRLVNYYLVDSKGAPRLVTIRGWDWCGTGRRNSTLQNQTIRLARYMDGSVIAPGSYSLAVVVGEHGESHSARTMVGSVVATSKVFQIRPTNTTGSLATVSGRVSVTLDPKAKLSANAKEEFFNRKVYVILESNLKDPYTQSNQLRITPQKDGSFDATVKPGTYKVYLGNPDETDHSFFQDHHLAITGSPVQTITIKAGENYRLGYRLEDLNQENDRGSGYLDFKAVPEKL